MYETTSTSGHLVQSLRRPRRRGRAGEQAPVRARRAGPRAPLQSKSKRGATGPPHARDRVACACLCPAGGPISDSRRSLCWWCRDPRAALTPSHVTTVSRPAGLRRSRVLLLVRGASSRRETRGVMYAATVHNGRSRRSQGYGKPETQLAAISFAPVTHQLTTPPLFGNIKFVLFLPKPLAIFSGRARSLGHK
jgi:hypothetical protein